MTALITFDDHPPLHDPVMLIALEGWIDAGMGAHGAISSLFSTQSWHTIATFDTDELLDFRARRPLLTLTDGVIQDLTWPSIEIRALQDEQGRHVIALVGAEPDRAWHRFVTEVLDAAQQLGVSTIIGMGAYPAAVPHTRPTRLSVSSPSEAIVQALQSYTRGTIEVPGGMQAVIEAEAAHRGIRSLSLWAQVPHYISGMPFPAASVAILEGLERAEQLSFPLSFLAEQAADSRRQLDELVADNDQHEDMIRQLERLYDAQPLEGLGPLPTGDELAAEVQAFLRDQTDD